MSNTARKARKREGIQFTRPVKVATPLQERESFKFMQPEKAAQELTIRGFAADVVENAANHLRSLRKVRRDQRRAAGLRN